MAAQFSATNGPSERSESSCIVLASTSFPVPDSPLIMIEASDGATLRATSKIDLVAGSSAIIAAESNFDPMVIRSTALTRAAASKGFCK